MKISVKDISSDLGYCEVTICRWIRDGKLKGEKIREGRSGWARWVIDEKDYKIFLDENPTLRLVHEGIKYGKKVKYAREDLCNTLKTRINSIKCAFKTEEHGKVYKDGFNDAISRIEAVIEKEYQRRFVEDQII